MNLNFKEYGAEFGEHVSKCSDASIASLIAERVRMISFQFGEEAVKQFESGITTALKNKILLDKGSEYKVKTRKKRK